MRLFSIKYFIILSVIDYINLCVNFIFLFSGELCLTEIKIPGTNITKTEWKPLLLIVPLRLGLTDINPIYISGVQVTIKNIYLVDMIEIIILN